MFYGHPVPFSFESLRLFMMCEATRWAHLPVDGGWYGQHPQLIDEFNVIWEAQNQYHEETKPVDPETERRNNAREYADFAQNSGPRLS